jgi:hypothetical protein
MNNPAPQVSRRRWFLVGGLVIALVLVAVASKVVFEKTRPVSISPLSAIPAKWNLSPGKKMEDLSEFYVEYKLTGTLPGKPTDEFYLVVHGPDAVPYMRILRGDDLQKGGFVGLAVRKNGATYRAALRGYDFKGNGPRYSNTLTFKF